MDKTDIIKNALKLFQIKTTDDLKQSNERREKLEEDIVENEPAPEEWVQETMYECYLEGILDALNLVIDILDNEKLIDKVMEKLEELKNGKIAKA